MKSVAVIAAGLVALNAVGGEAVHWGYEGEHGPAHWAEISDEFSACEGHNQSPIDLVMVKMIEADLEPIHFHYQDVPLAVRNNGHTIQVNCAPGSHIIVDGITFELKQFHFHSPSENRINGQAYPLEGHLVHADGDGNLAVVAVMFQEGESHPLLARIWQQMPATAGGDVQAPDVSINAEALLPSDRDYFRYNGSLTTPPCSEGVRWLVIKAHATASATQLDTFREVMGVDNNRPVQPVNARPVLK